MKGVLICGGLGTRLRPLSEVTNKSLLPVYDQPLIYYPLQVLLQAGITDIMVITGPEHIDHITSFLGSGAKWNCQFTYRVQDEPKGIAQALGMAEQFAAGDSICALLGDNVYFDTLAPIIRGFQGGAHVFVKEVPDPKRFGIVELNGDQVVSVEEKPEQPRSNLALTGCYVFDNQCFNFVRNLQPSARGELEITDVVRGYMQQGRLRASVLQDEWIDAGTIESLYKAATQVRMRKLQQLEQPVEQAVQQAKQPQPAPTQQPPAQQQAAPMQQPTQEQQQPIPPAAPPPVPPQQQYPAQ